MVIPIFTHRVNKPYFSLPTGVMMNTQSELCSFFSVSPKRHSKLVSIIGDNETVKELCSLSQTRWVERWVKTLTPSIY